MSDDTSKHLNNVVPIDEQELQGHLNKVGAIVKSSV